MLPLAGVKVVEYCQVAAGPFCGLLLADNTLQSGNVTDAAHTNNNVVAMRAFNAKVAADPRVRQVLVPIGDGVTFIQKL